MTPGESAPGMEPIDESARALSELEPGVDDVQLLVELRRRSEQTAALVPDCIGMSVAARELGVTLTLVSTTRSAAVLDATQYLSSGPCIDALDRGDVRAYTVDELLDEESWRLFSQTAAAAGVASTLTLPVMADGQVSGTINLYASTPHAFDGHHEELADVFGAWAAGATTNADLSFRTLETARSAPRVLADRVLIETAAGLIMAEVDVSADEAHRRLAEAARRAGVSEVDVAEAVLTASKGSESWPHGLGLSS